MFTADWHEGNYLTLLKNLYWTHNSRIGTEKLLYKEKKNRHVLGQCWVLSPCMFNLYTEMIFREVENCKGVNIRRMNINTLRYADDTVLLAENRNIFTS